jgi:smoothened protein
MILLVYLAALLPFAKLELDHSYEANSNKDNKTWNDLGRHRIKDSSYLLDRYPLGELPTDYVHCKRPAKCVRMNNGACMGTRLPYETTTLDLIPEYTSQAMIRVINIIFHS